MTATETVNEDKLASKDQGTETASHSNSKGDLLKAYGIVGALAVIWIGATVLFGFAGLITVALIMVVSMFALLMLISRG
ncbi:MAG: hypothetical protein AAGI03_15380 [Pseudomonadota bacterium]